MFKMHMPVTKISKDLFPQKLEMFLLIHQMKIKVIGCLLQLRVPNIGSPAILLCVTLHGLKPFYVTCIHYIHFLTGGCR